MKNVKIAIECDNQAEHDALMKHMEELGYRWSNGKCPTDNTGFSSLHPCNYYHDDFFKNNRSGCREKDYQIVPFKAFAALKGLPIPSEPIQVVLNDQYTATITENGVKVGCSTFSFETIAELCDAVNKFRNA